MKLLSNVFREQINITKRGTTVQIKFGIFLHSLGDRRAQQKAHTYQWQGNAPLVLNPTC